jgi:hypothetical protein
LRIVAHEHEINEPHQQRQHREHGEERPPAERDRQRNAEREIRGDGEAVSGENDAHDRRAA